MAMTFDAPLKDMGRDAPLGFLTAFDQLPTIPDKPLNVDLSTVTTAGDLILGLGPFRNLPNGVPSRSRCATAAGGINSRAYEDT